MSNNDSLPSASSATVGRQDTVFGKLLDGVPRKQSFIPDVFTRDEQKAQQEAQEAAEKQRWKESSITDVATEAINLNQIGPMMLRQANRPDLEDDPTFFLNKEVFKQEIQGQIPKDYWDEFDPLEIRSMGQLQQKRQEILDFMERQNTLMSMGTVTGVSASVLASILDPVAIGVSAASYGATAPLIYGNKVTRIGRAVKAGLLSMGVTAPIEGYIAYNDPTYDLDDAVVSTMAAGALGGLFTGLSRSYDEPLKELYRAAAANEAREAGAVAAERGMVEFKGLVNPDGSFKTVDQVNTDFFERNKGWKTFASKLRIDRAADNFSSASAKIRGLSGALFEDSAPAKGSVIGETASLWKRREQGRVMRAYLKSQKATFRDYLEETGQGWTQSFAAKRQFNRDVTRALRGIEVESAAVKKHASEVRRLYDEMANMARNPAGKERIDGAVPVKGAEGMTVDDYVNRRWSAASMDGMIQKLGSRAAVQRQIASAIRGMDEDMAMQVADHLMKVVSRSRQGGLDISGLSRHGDNLQWFLEREHGLDAGEAKNIAESLRRLTGGMDAGKAANLKARLDIDESLVEDLLENDIDVLFSGYANTMLGHIALARRGIDSEDTFRRLFAEAQDELYSTPVTGKAEELKRRRELRNLEEAYDHLVGRPLREDPSSGYATAGRLLRKYNYSRLMNMVGLAQIAEFGVMASHVGVKNMMANMPELLKLRRKIKNGDFSDELVEELSDLMGGWADYRLLHRSAQRIEEFGDAGAMREGILSRMERGLDTLNNVTTDISGFNYVNQVLHVMTMKSMAQTFLDAARKGKKHILGADRLKELGIDNDLYARIKGELMKKGGASFGPSGKLKKLNLENWDDEVRVKFGNALRRWGDQVIQENDFGSLPGFMSTTTGKLLMQFKSFMLGAYTKQLLNNVKHADRTTTMMFLNGTFAGLISYLAYVGASSAGKSKYERERYLDKMLDPMQMAAGAFQRSSISTIIPGIIDMPAMLGLYDPLFDTRASGLQSNLITGSASYDLAMKTGQFGQEVVEAIRDGEITSNTARSFFSLLPYQNAMGIRNGLNVLYDELPRDYSFE